MKDPDTTEYLERIGVSAGWRCLEVGGGGGSITNWLCQKVGSTGNVIATDMDTRFLDVINSPNLEVRTHNISTDDLEVSSYDLVHARSVLLHLNDWRGAVKKMADALKPGGWLLLEDPDIADTNCDASTEEPDRKNVDHFFDAFKAAVTGIGWDMSFGTNTLKCLKDNGLDMLSSEGRTYAFFGGSPYAEYYQLTTEQLTERILATELITSEGINEFMELTKKPTTGFRSMKNVFTWGRKPF